MNSKRFCFYKPRKEFLMDKVLEKDIETKEEVKLILERLEETKNGKVKTIDDSVKDFINEREVWKTLA